jgi:hypothetical protein
MSADETYLCIPDARYRELTHYGTTRNRTGTLPWYKLHTILVLDNPGFVRLPEQMQLHILKLWAYALRLQNKLPNDPDYLAHVIRAENLDLRRIVKEGWLDEWEENEQEEPMEGRVSQQPREPASRSGRKRVVVEPY